MKLKISSRQQKILLLKKIISKGLIVGFLFNNMGYSFANASSLDDRYETFEGSNITINDILEEDKVDIEIEGNTVVNDCIEDTSNEITITGINHFNKDKIKPNAEYTIVFDIIENNLLEGEYFVSELHNQKGDSKFYISSGETGRFVKKVNTYENVSFILWIKDSDGNETNQSNVKIKNLMLLEGDWTNKEIPEYFEGIKSVGQDDENGHKVEILSINKNLFNATNDTIEDVYGMTEHTYENEILRVYNTREVTFNRCRYSINLKGDTWYTFSCNYNINLGSSAYVTLSNDSYEDIETINEDDKSISFKFLTNSHGKTTILFYSTLDTLEIGDVNFYNIQVEENIKSTDYIPHQSNALQIPLSEPLRSLPNGVKDKIIKKNGQWVIERNLGEKVLNGDNTAEYYLTTYDASYNTTICYAKVNFNNLKLGNNIQIINDKFKSVTGDTYSAYEESVYIWGDEIYGGLYVQLESNRLSQLNTDGFKEWLLQNPITVVYELENPIYEQINTNPTLNLYLDTTHISNSSNIPANIKVTVDRAMNRATEAIKLAKENPTIENISQARYWANLLKETIKKDEVNNQINDITTPLDLKIEKKKASANIDIYVKSDNALSMTLSTNSIVFDNYTGVNDLEKINALEVTIHSSLPYDLNAYLEENLQNSDKSVTMDSNLLKIKESNDDVYKSFANTTDKIILKENNNYGNYNKHNIDLKIEGSNAYKADVYKATIKLEAQQK